MFKNVDNIHTHTYGRQRPTYTISSPMSLFKGSGELKTKELLKTFEKATRNTLTNFAKLMFFPCIQGLAQVKCNK